jgi:hypothetical protein
VGNMQLTRWVLVQLQGMVHEDPRLHQLPSGNATAARPDVSRQDVPVTDAILFMAAQGCTAVSLWHHATLPCVQHAKKYAWLPRLENAPFCRGQGTDAERHDLGRPRQRRFRGNAA